MLGVKIENVTFLIAPNFGSRLSKNVITLENKIIHKEDNKYFNRHEIVQWLDNLI